MELNIQTAELALRKASESNPGAWADHSQFVAEACKNIASHCKDLSSEQAYIFGLLHDCLLYTSKCFCGNSICDQGCILTRTTGSHSIYQVERDVYKRPLYKKSQAGIFKVT